MTDRQLPNQTLGAEIESVLSRLNPENQMQMREWIADGTFTQRAIDTMFEQGHEILRLEKQVTAQTAQVLDPEALRDALAESLTSVYVCGRVWSAWNVGTMTEDDFQPGAECDELLDELVYAVTSCKTEPEPVIIGMRDAGYKDSTPLLHVGDSAFEDWFQAQPFATQSGIKQISRDSYAAGMGDPLVTYATPPNRTHTEENKNDIN